MLQLKHDVGEVQWQEIKSVSAIGGLYNYNERPYTSGVPVSAISFSPQIDAIALGDKHGRVLVLHLLRATVFQRFDPVTTLTRCGEISRSPFSRKKRKPLLLSRNTAVRALVFCQVDSHSLLTRSENNHQILFAALANYIVQVVEEECTSAIVLDHHKLPVHTLCWLPKQLSIFGINGLPGALVSGSLDTMIVWNPMDWTMITLLEGSLAILSACTVNHLACPTNFKSYVGLSVNGGRIQLWDVTGDGHLVANLEESTWKTRLWLNCSADLLDRKQRSGPRAHLTITSANANCCSAAFTSQTMMTVLAAGKLIGLAKFSGVIIAWSPSIDTSNKAVELDVIALKDTPVQLQLVHLKGKESAGRQYLTHIAILTDLGCIEVRLLNKMSQITYVVKPFAFSSKSLLSRKYSPVRNLLRSTSGRTTCKIICFSVDIDNKYLILGNSDGSIQLLSLQSLSISKNNGTVQNDPPKKTAISDSDLISDKRNSLRHQEASSTTRRRSLFAKRRHSFGGRDKFPLGDDRRTTPEDLLKSENGLSSDLTFRHRSVRADTPDSSPTHSAVHLTNSDSPRNLTFKKINGRPAFFRLANNSSLNPTSSRSSTISSGNLLSPDMKPTVLPACENSVVRHIISRFPKCKVPHSLYILYVYSTSEIGWGIHRKKPNDTKNSNQFLEGGSLISLAQLRSRCLLASPFQYPNTYRPEVWQLLLELPLCQKALDPYLQALEADKKVHPHYRDLHSVLPIKNQQNFRRLQKVLSLLAYWCPSLTEVCWLPQLVFAVVTLYGQKILFSFEVLISMLLWWSSLGCKNFLNSSQSVTNEPSLDRCQHSLRFWGWFCGPRMETPPVGLLCFSSYVFLKEDRDLWGHILTHWNLLDNQMLQQLEASYVEKGFLDEVSSSEGSIVENVHTKLGVQVLWPLIRSFLSEAIPKHLLASLWDHFFTSPMRPLLVNCAAISFLIQNRLTLFSLPNCQSYYDWLISSRFVSFESLVDRMYCIDGRISEIYLHEVVLGEAIQNGQQQHLSKSRNNVVTLLSDLGWPIWRVPSKFESSNVVSSDSVSFMDGFLYPELVCPMSSLEKDEKSIIDAMETQRAQLAELLQSRLQTHQTTKQFIATDEQADLIDALVMADSAVALDFEFARMAQEEAIHEKAVLQRASKKKSLADEIQIRRKIIEFYNNLLSRLPSFAKDKRAEEIVKSDHDDIKTPEILAETIAHASTVWSHEKLESQALSLWDKAKMRQRIIEEELQMLESMQRSPMTPSDTTHLPIQLSKKLLSEAKKQRALLLAATTSSESSCSISSSKANKLITALEIGRHQFDRRQNMKKRSQEGPNAAVQLLQDILENKSN